MGQGHDRSHRPPERSPPGPLPHRAPARRGRDELLPRITYSTSVSFLPRPGPRLPDALSEFSEHVTIVFACRIPLHRDLRSGSPKGNSILHRKHRCDLANPELHRALRRRSFDPALRDNSRAAQPHFPNYKPGRLDRSSGAARCRLVERRSGSPSIPTPSPRPLSIGDSSGDAQREGGWQDLLPTATFHMVKRVRPSRRPVQEMTWALRPGLFLAPQAIGESKGTEIPRPESTSTARMERYRAYHRHRKVVQRP